MDSTDGVPSPNWTITDAASSSIENSNDNWQKVPPRHTAKRKFESPASPSYEQTNKFHTLDNEGDDKEIIIEEPQFQTAVSGPTSRIPPSLFQTLNSTGWNSGKKSYKHIRKKNSWKSKR
ncbi:hypothetical protein JTE90_004163 [Oedothorax gibbosus]|uniref:Uncharacterized protein n=1 Tax=Oedothorax gibbosus TaxID=931172 RepID=A0AAV6TVT2_9ARAC|nr:hypothetical protein JTE90_004163 [Oedothorax gibbosus]